MTHVVSSRPQVVGGNGLLRRRSCRLSSELFANALCGMQITFTSSCAMAACIIGYLDSFDHKTTTVYKVPLFSWLLVLTAIWPALALAAVAVNVTVLLIEAALSFLENVSYVLMGLSRALKCAACPL